MMLVLLLLLLLVVVVVSVSMYCPFRVLPLDAITIASGVSNVVERQDAPPRVVAPLIDEMNRHASARPTIVV